MRLINVRTFKLEEFFDADTPPYAILSHTWGREEVSLQEWVKVDELSRQLHRLANSQHWAFANSTDNAYARSLEDTRQEVLQAKAEIELKSGYAKILACCSQAAKDGYTYVWVDTCCIDKTSSAELSEAINSMYRWYEDSKICYAYLADVPKGLDSVETEAAFRNSRWFTRGWTLQELLAPRNVIFYNAGWTEIYTKATSKALLSEISRIDDEYLDTLETYELQSSPIAQRMSWVSNRQTTRKEDMAYCLLGIFDVNMPLLYGEGDKAFIRLQEEIMKQSDDLSILAWGYGLPPSKKSYGLFAPSPVQFAGCNKLRRNHSYFDPTAGTPLTPTIHSTNATLVIRLCCYFQPDQPYSVYALTNCGDSTYPYLGVPLVASAQHSGGGARKTGILDGEFWRPPCASPILLSYHSPGALMSHHSTESAQDWKFSVAQISIMKRLEPGSILIPNKLIRVYHIEAADSIHFELYPPHAWSSRPRVLRTQLDSPPLRKESTLRNDTSVVYLRLWRLGPGGMLEGIVVVIDQTRQKPMTSLQSQGPLLRLRLVRWSDFAVSNEWRELPPSLAHMALEGQPGHFPQERVVTVDKAVTTFEGFSIELPRGAGDPSLIPIIKIGEIDETSLTLAPRIETLTVEELAPTANR